MLIGWVEALGFLCSPYLLLAKNFDTPLARRLAFTTVGTMADPEKISEIYTLARKLSKLCVDIWLNKTRQRAILSSVQAGKLLYPSCPSKPRQYSPLAVALSHSKPLFGSIYSI